MPPAQAVETNLRLWLTDTGLFRAVTAPGSRLNANYVLEAKLADFGADQNTNTARAALAPMLLAQRKGGAVVSVPVQRTVSARDAVGWHRTDGDRRGDDSGSRPQAAADRGDHRRNGLGSAITFLADVSDGG